MSPSLGGGGEPLLETVLLAGFSKERHDALNEALTDLGCDIVWGGPRQGKDLIGEIPCGVVCLGEELPASACLDLFEVAAGRESDLLFIVTAGRDGGGLATLAGRTEIYYLGGSPLPVAEWIDLILGALMELKRRRAREGGAERLSATRERAGWLEVLLGDAPDWETVAHLTVSALEETVAADHWRFWIWDFGRRNLRSVLKTNAARGDFAASGITGFAARTGLPVRVAQAAADPRHEAGIDNPSRLSDPRFMAVPLVNSEDRVLAVATALRSRQEPEFSSEDEQAAKIVVEPAVSALGRAQAAAPVQAFSQIHPAAAPASNLFRPEAVRESVRDSEAEGGLLRDTPGWAEWTYWILLGGCLALVLFGVFGRVGEYAAGPAFVRARQTEVTSAHGGNVATVLAAVGSGVKEGQPVVRFDDADERAELRRLNREWVVRLRQRLRDPADESVAAALVGLRSALEQAQARLEQRLVRAPCSGVVQDVRIRPGQRLEAGQVLLSIVENDTRGKVVALIPGRFRPLLREGQTARLELDGYPYRLQSLVVQRVGEEVIGQGEARRYLGEVIADSVSVDGPVVLVEAALEADSFEVGGRRHRYHTGMRGVVEIRVRSEPIVLSLIPSLRAVLETER